MKIGVFDSGLGGLFVLRALAREMPEYDYVYLGDTQRVPYGNRSRETIFKFLEEAVEALFKKDCGLVVVACNTASAEALRKIQQEYLPRNAKRYPGRRVLGVIIPTAEVALAGKNSQPPRIGVLATQATVRSGTYERELKKIDPRAQIFQQAAPLLVPLIENDGARWAEPIVRAYLAPLLRKKIDTLILGCTHYPALKGMIKKIAGEYGKGAAAIRIISQDEIIPGKLKNYLKRHPEINKTLKKNHKRELLVTDITPAYEQLAREWFGKNVRLRKAIV